MLELDVGQYSPATPFVVSPVCAVADPSPYSLGRPLHSYFHQHAVFAHDTMSADSTGLNAGASLPRDSLTWEPQQSPQQSPAGAHDPAQERTSSRPPPLPCAPPARTLPASRSFNAGRSLRGPTPAADIDMDSAVEPWVDAGGGEELQDLPRAPQRSSGGVPAGGDRNRSPASDCDALAALGHRRPGTADRGGACKARRRPARAKSARQSGGLGPPTRQGARRGKAEGHHLDRIAYEPPPEARVVKRRDACMALFGRCAARPGTAGPAVRPAQAIPVQGDRRRPLTAQCSASLHPPPFLRTATRDLTCGPSRPSSARQIAPVLYKARGRSIHPALRLLANSMDWEAEGEEAVGHVRD